MNPDEIRRLVREVNAEVDQEIAETQKKVWEENRLANEAQKPSPADLIEREWRDLDGPYLDLDRITGRLRG